MAEGERSGKGGGTPEQWLGEPELVLIWPRLAQGELRGDLATALQLAWCVLPALLHARSSLGIGAACQTHGPEPGGIFLPPSLGSLGAAGGHGLEDVNRCHGAL